VLAADGHLADVAGDQVHSLDLRDGHVERLRDRGFDEPFAEADAHLAGYHLDHESRGPRIEPAEQSLERRGLGGALCTADRLQGRGDVGKRGVLAESAAFERLTGPVAQVRVLPE
jgi:hypothetical protein